MTRRSKSSGSPASSRSRKARLDNTQMISSPTSSSPTPTLSSSPPPPPRSDKTRLLLLHPLSSQPPFLAFNQFVHHGYRRHPLPWIDALKSLFYFHNETINIFSHLLGGLICVYWVVMETTHTAIETKAQVYERNINNNSNNIPLPLPPHPYTRPHGSHYLSVALADAASAVCFFASAAYHTFMSTPSTKAGYVSLMTADVWGIWIVNTGASIVLTHTLFPCEDISTFYSSILVMSLIMIPTIGSFLWILLIAQNPKSRAAAFFICWIMRVGTIVQAAMFGVVHYNPVWLGLHLASEMFSPLGAIINVLRIPEKWFPGKFDLFFQSHNIMHICVAIGMLSQHYLGMARANHIDSQPDLFACTQGNKFLE